MMRLRRGQRGTAGAEFAILLPIMLLLVVGLVDLARMIYAQQLLSDLSRETANLVSRGTTPADAIDSVVRTSEVFDVDSDGFVVISTIRRTDAGNDNPWIFSQAGSGALTEFLSRVGANNGPASLPGIDSLPVGVTLMAVEIVQDFEPIFEIKGLGMDFYPDTLYQAAYF
jgi:hypothetical protein